MLELQLLGTLDLTPDSGHPDAAAILAKPKLTGVLGYLLIAKGEAWCRRDELAARFWPESDQQHARRALSQAIYQLRKHLGSEIIESRGTEDVRVDASRVRCDVLEVQRRLAAGEVEAALAAYTGDLLPAFHLPDAAPFTDWLDRERDLLRRAVTDAALDLARRAPDRAGLRAAARWAVEHNLLDGDVTRRAMRILAEGREHAAALAMFEAHADACRRELEMEPGADAIAMAALVREDPRHLTPLDTPLPRSGAGTTPPEPASPFGQPDRPAIPSHPRWSRTVLSLVSVTALVLLLVAVANRVGGIPAGDAGLVAVMPWAYEGPEAERFLAGALPVELLPRFDGTVGLRAVPQTRVEAQLTALGASWQSPLTPDQERELARDLGAGSYLTATVVSDGTVRQVTANLVNTATGETRLRAQLPFDGTNRNTSLDRLYLTLLTDQVGLASRREQLLGHPLIAVRPYLDAHRARREQRYLDALRGYRRAMDLDSTFALAALGYREVAIWLEDGTPQRESLERAEGISRRFVDRLSRADSAVSEAIFATHRLEHDGEYALQAIRHATIVGPDRPVAWLLYGDFLLHDGAMLDRQDHVDDAREAFDSLLALGDTIPEALRHLTEMRFARQDSAHARAFLRGHAPRLSHWQHLEWLARSLTGDSLARHAFGPDLAKVARDTLRLMVLWSQRATTALADGDSAATLLGTVQSVDSGTRMGDREVLRYHAINRGRPLAGARASTMRGSGIHGDPHARLLLAALVTPGGWLPRDSIARAMLEHLGEADPDDALPRRCTLGLWQARWGSEAEALRLGRSLEAWERDPRARYRGYALACRRVVGSLVAGRHDLTALEALAAYLRTEPAGTLRSDLSAWNLLAADAVAERGRPDLALPLTTRLGFIVEGAYWVTPALLREAEWSLALGDSARAGRAYRRAAALLSEAEPAIEAEAERVRRAGRQLP